MAVALPRSGPGAKLVALLALLVVAALGFAALGVWQVERLAWKRALIARVDARVHAAPVAAPGPTEWTGLTRDNAEYRRVEVRGRFDASRQVLVTAVTDLGGGYWVLAPLRTREGISLLVNRGFVPPEQRKTVPPPAAGDVQVVGLLRLTEPGGGFLRSNVPAEDRWYSRDVQAIARTLGLQGHVAPYFIDAQSVDGATGGWPRPGLTVVQFPNNHLGYALTWFALAAGSLGAAVFLLRDDRRHRTAQPTSLEPDRHAH
ncbi:SURF1 family protein [Ramlibacter sp. MMS24-I3-19]|uniref:SURF1 family protein n=1 Tax=Ramlibacter sp. MMS24-I3-19 TaxID=3416606 RepID=UPI003D0900E1